MTVGEPIKQNDIMRDALKSISSLWPEPPNAADMLAVNGINDGRNRAILIDGAIKLARTALEKAG